MNILYSGPYFSEKAIREKPSISQAAARWSIGLVNALRNQGHYVEVISHCPEQMWPRGKVFWQDNDAKWFCDSECHRIAYPNIPVLRDVWVNASYALQVKQACKRMKFDAFLCYNTIIHCHIVAMKAARNLGVKCYPIILDGDDPRKDNWRRLLRETCDAAGVVFLSDWLLRNYPKGTLAGGHLPVHHLDGGAEGFMGDEPSECSVGRVFTVLHTGSLNKQRELGFIAKALQHYKDSNTKFVFTGKVNYDDVLEMCGDDPRIEVKGFVSTGELNAICRGADAFLNVREPNHRDNVVNFPSKLPQSLSWGRPVVSTWVESLAPDYKDFLFLADGNSPEGLAVALDRVRELDIAQRASYYDREKAWFVANKTWDAQACRLVSWLRQDMGK